MNEKEEKKKIEFPNEKELKKIIINKMLYNNYILFQGELNIIEDNYYINNNEDFDIFIIPTFPPKLYGLGKKNEKLREGLKKSNVSDFEFKNLLFVKIVQQISETSAYTNITSYNPDNPDNISLEKTIENIINKIFK